MWRGIIRDTSVRWSRREPRLDSAEGEGLRLLMHAADGRRLSGVRGKVVGKLDRLVAAHNVVRAKLRARNGIKPLPKIVHARTVLSRLNFRRKHGVAVLDSLVVSNLCILRPPASLFLPDCFPHSELFRFLERKI